MTEYCYEPSDDTITFRQNDAEMTFDYLTLCDIVTGIGIIRNGSKDSWMMCPHCRTSYAADEYPKDGICKCCHKNMELDE